MVRAYRELESPNGQICWDNIEFFAILKWPKPKNDVWKKMMSVQSSFATKKPLKIRRCEKCGLALGTAVGYCVDGNCGVIFTNNQL